MQQLRKFNIDCLVAPKKELLIFWVYFLKKNLYKDVCIES